jgi:hypothetical protein
LILDPSMREFCTSPQSQCGSPCGSPTCPNAPRAPHHEGWSFGKAWAALQNEEEEPLEEEEALKKKKEEEEEDEAWAALDKAWAALEKALKEEEEEEEEAEEREQVHDSRGCL